MTAPNALPPETLRTIVRLVNAGETQTEIATRFGISSGTVGRVVRRHEMRLVPPATHRGRDLRWMEQAHCQGWAGFTEMHVEEQARVCDKGSLRLGLPGACPVQAECLQFGMQFHLPSNAWPKGEGPVYGGVGPKELTKSRRGMRERRAS